MASVLSAPHYHNEDAAFAYVERHLWPEGPNCPHCGGVERISKMQGKATRKGLHKCYQCRKQFTVRMGTIFESSHLPLHIWLQAIFFVAGSKKGVSSNQLHRTLGVTLKTAWFLSHRIREAMRDGALLPLGGAGEIVEVDETFIGHSKGRVVAKGFHHKMKVLSLVERGGKSRSIVVDSVGMSTLLPIVKANLDRESHVMTDEASAYRYLSHHFAKHTHVVHSRGEYGRGETSTNTIEGFFSIFKRGMRGVYQFCGEKHLHRYLAEFDFRYSNRAALGCNDIDRAEALLRGVIGKRLTYQRACART
ncbi:MAG: IS1595 family transposase [Sphingomicrobium sp.]